MGTLVFFLIFNRSEGLCYREVTRSENLGGELYVMCEPKIKGGVGGVGPRSAARF